MPITSHSSSVISSLYSYLLISSILSFNPLFLPLSTTISSPLLISYSFLPIPPSIFSFPSTTSPLYLPSTSSTISHRPLITFFDRLYSASVYSPLSPSSISSFHSSFTPLLHILYSTTTPISTTTITLTPLPSSITSLLLYLFHLFPFLLLFFSAPVAGIYLSLPLHFQLPFLSNFYLNLLYTLHLPFFF